MLALTTTQAPSVQTLAPGAPDLAADRRDARARQRLQTARAA
jgi:hypothetical protein